MNSTKNKKNPKKIIWGISGAGRFLEESVDQIKELSKENKITVLLSKAGDETIKMYKQTDKLQGIDIISGKEQGYSYSFSGDLSLGKYDHLIISPCSANTAAKLAHGIADTLLTNSASQALKSGTKVSVVPTDLGESSKSKTPNGEEVVLKHRKVDQENIEKLKEDGINIFESPEELMKEV